MILDVIIHNVNAMSSYGGLDMFISRTSTGRQGWAEANIGIMFEIMNKNGMSKGGQIVMVTYVGNVFPRAYAHWNNMHNHPANFKAQVPNKVCMIIDKLEEMVVGYPTAVGVNKLYDTQP